MTGSRGEILLMLKLAPGLGWLRGHYFDVALAGWAIAAAVLFVASLR